MFLVCRSFGLLSPDVVAAVVMIVMGSNGIKSKQGDRSAGGDGKEQPREKAAEQQRQPTVREGSGGEECDHGEISSDLRR